MPGYSGVAVVTTLVCLFICMRGCGRVERPAFPAPSDFTGGKVQSKTRADAARSRNCVCKPPFHFLPTERGPAHGAKRLGGSPCGRTQRERSQRAHAVSRRRAMKRDAMSARASMGLVERPLAVGTVERKRRHLDLESISVFALHLVTAGHEAGCGLKRNAAGVFEALAGREHRLLSDHAFAAYFLPLAGRVGDDPVP